jgi:hypothetical protein
MIAVRTSHAPALFRTAHYGTIISTINIPVAIKIPSAICIGTSFSVVTLAQLPDELFELLADACLGEAPQKIYA